MNAVRTDLPSGTVTFLFTDIEGSTKLLYELGAEAYAEALAEHRRILREAFRSHGGVEVDTQGDAFFVAFATAPGALRAAAEAMDGLTPGPIQVRVGLHTGTPLLTHEGYVGNDVHKGARIASGWPRPPGAGINRHGCAAGHRWAARPRPAPAEGPVGRPSACQLGVDDFAPLKTLYRTNLPIPATPFLGRQHELTEVIGLLSRKDLRLLTLTGPGGFRTLTRTLSNLLRLVRRPHRSDLASASTRAWFHLRRRRQCASPWPGSSLNITPSHHGDSSDHRAPC